MVLRGMTRTYARLLLGEYFSRRTWVPARFVASQAGGRVRRPHLEHTAFVEDRQRYACRARAERADVRHGVVVRCCAACGFRRLRDSGTDPPVCRDAVVERPVPHVEKAGATLRLLERESGAGPLRWLVRGGLVAAAEREGWSTRSRFRLAESASTRLCCPRRGPIMPREGRVGHAQTHCTSGAAPSGLYASVACSPTARASGCRAGPAATARSPSAARPTFPRAAPTAATAGAAATSCWSATPRGATCGAFRRGAHFRAKRGGHGEGNQRHGANAAALEVPVPPGTVAEDAERGRALGPHRARPARRGGARGPGRQGQQAVRRRGAPGAALRRARAARARRAGWSCG